MDEYLIMHMFFVTPSTIFPSSTVSIYTSFTIYTYGTYKETFTLLAKCARTSIELGSDFHAKWHDEGSELLRNFKSTSIELHTKWHRN